MISAESYSGVTTVAQTTTTDPICPIVFILELPISDAQEITIKNNRNSCVCRKTPCTDSQCSNSDLAQALYVAHPLFQQFTTIHTRMDKAGPQRPTLRSDQVSKRKRTGHFRLRSIASIRLRPCRHNRPEVAFAGCVAKKPFRAVWGRARDQSTRK